MIRGPATEPGKSVRAVLRLLVLFNLLVHATAVRAGGDPRADGTKLFLAGQKQESLSLFREALKRNPRDLFAHKSYQQALKNLNRWEEVASEYKTNLASRPADGFAYYLYAAAIQEVDQNERASVIRKGLQAAPSNAWLQAASRLDAAMELIAKGKAGVVLAQTSSPEKYPFPPDVQMVRAAAFAEENKIGAAITAVQESIRQFPLDPDTYLELCDLLSSTGQFEGALANCKIASGIRPSAAASNGLGGALDMLGRTAEARTQFVAALKASSATINDVIAQGYTYQTLGRKDETGPLIAEAERRSLELGSKFNLLRLKLSTRASPQDVAELKKFRALYPANPSLLLADAYFRAYHGDCAGALPLFQRMIAANAGGSFGLQGNAVCELEEGHTAEGLENIAQAIRLAPNYYDLYRLQGDAHSNLKNYDEAIKSYRKALAINPEYGNAHYGLCAAFGAQEKREEAIAACMNAITYSTGLEAKTQAQALLCAVQHSCAPQVDGIDFSDKLQSCFGAAESVTSGVYAEEVSPARLASAILQFGRLDHDAHAYEVLSLLRAPQADLEVALHDKGLKSGPELIPPLPWSQAVVKTIQRATKIAAEHRSPKSREPQITTAHVLLAILQEDADARALAAMYRVTPERFAKALDRFYQSDPPREDFSPATHKETR